MNTNPLDNEYNLNKHEKEINAYIKSIKEENIEKEEKLAKVQKLIVLLLTIEEELKVVNKTLNMLLNYSLKAENVLMERQVEKKLKQLENVNNKINSVRLNLNYHFL